MEKGGIGSSRVTPEGIRQHAQARANGTHEITFENTQPCGDYGFLTSKPFFNVEAKRTAEMQCAGVWVISPSVDGAWLSALFSLLGIGTIRGSSGRQGTSALGEA
jgi:hypothetical protein